MDLETVVKRLVEQSMVTYYDVPSSVIRTRENREKLDMDRSVVLELFPKGSPERERLLKVLSVAQRSHDNPSYMRTRV